MGKPSGVPIKRKAPSAHADQDRDGVSLSASKPVKKVKRSGKSSGKKVIATDGSGRASNRAYSKDDPACDPKEFFEWIIDPISSDEFFDKYWEKKPLLISRTDRKFFDGWFSKDDLDRLLRTSVVKYEVNLDVVKCVDGVRQTLTPTGRAYPASVWNFFEDGCSLRLLNPQTFVEPVWRMLSILQEFFGSGMGANIYLTPANTQGFQVHYDDIEAFVLQLEGSKRWRVYPPRNADEVLPKYSSRNFTEDEIGTPVIDTVLHAGDTLYFPRGWVHQANATDTHSLHITVSTYQDNSWGTFLEKALPRALQIAFEDDVEFRRGLPLNYLDYMGTAKMERSEGDPRRAEFSHRVAALMKTLAKHVPVDAVADQMGVKYLEDSYPPVLSPAEVSATVTAGVVYDEKKDRTGAGKSLSNDHDIGMDTWVRPVRKNIARIVMEENTVSVYHSLENGRVYHQDPPQRLEFPTDCGPILEYVLECYPGYVQVGAAPGIDEDEELLDVVVALYDAGLLMKRL